MRDLGEILEKINEAVSDYETKKLGLVHDQAEILRNISTGLYFLVSHKVEAHNKWMSSYMNHKGSNAARERFADSEVPELYLIRQVMSSAAKVQESLRSTISINK